MSSSTNVFELLSLRGKTALITGATGYLGSAMASALAEAGASVVVSSRRLAEAQRVAEQLPRAEAKHHGIEMDYLDEASIDSGFKAAVGMAGKIDILVNNGHEPMADDWRTVTGEQFTRQLSNLTGYFLLSRVMRDHAVARGAEASIVLIGSMYGVVGSYPQVYEGMSTASPEAYHALKGGVVHLVRHLAVYWAKDRIRVNCLSPGPFPQPRVSTELVERIAERAPMGRVGKPEELKGAIVFLASAASSYMTGQNLIIDGGWTAW